MNVNEAIRMKRAIREFDIQPLPDQIIHEILQAGRRAQSSKNTQPWQFIAITDKSILKAMSETGNYAGHLAGSALGVVIAHPDPTEKFQIMFDVGQSAAYMQLAAWEYGVGSCLASIYDEDKARSILGIPHDIHALIAISFGYPKYAEALSRKPRLGGRKPLKEIIHFNRW
jgi:nitroreductase